MDWIDDEDIREALKEMRTYLDITEEDLKKIFLLALEHARRKSTKRINVRDVMTRDVIKVKSNTGVEEILRILAENRISGVPVVDDEGRVIGIVTEADIISAARPGREKGFKGILRAVIGEPGTKKADLSGRRLMASDIMTSPVITATPEMDIKEVARVIDEKRIKRLPVVDSEGRLLGIISRQDIVRLLASES